MTLRRFVFPAIFVTMALAARPASGQLASDNQDVVDRVVAMVGDSAVLASQIQEEMQRMAFQGQDLPQDAAGRERLFRQVLDQYVQRLLILQAAAGDTLLTVDEGRVEEIVDQEIQRRTQSFGSQQALQDALAGEGLTLASYRDFLSNDVRQEQLQQMFVQRHLQGAPPVVVTEEELLDAFQDARGQLQQRPRTVTFHQVVVKPASSDSALAATRRKAEAIVDSLRAGADFAEMAQRYSQDPGSAPNGGDLGWFRRGQMVRSFEDAAFGLRDGEISNPVKSEFGFHIIKVERSRPGERRARHILLIPEVADADRQRARTLAEDLMARAREGADMEELYEEYSDPEAPDSLTVPYDQLDQLPPGYADTLRGAAQGSVVGPIQYDAGGAQARFAVVKIDEVREAGAYTFEDVRDQLENQITRRKQLEAILDQLRENTYIQILI
jgi:peptidyl-prolyl cis-trans isomerase SurA